MQASASDAPGGRPLEPVIERGEIAHGRVFGRGRGLFTLGRGRFGEAVGERLDPLGERSEAVPAGEIQEAPIFEFAGVHVVERAERRHRIAQGHEPLRHARLLSVLEQVLAALGLPDRRRVGEQAVQIAELLQQLRRGLDPDPRHAGHVVGSVAGERQHVAHQLRPDPEARDHLRSVDRLLLHRVVHLHALADQLHQILVRGDDDHLAPGGLGLAGIGRDDVVGLVAFELDHRQPERPGGLAHQRELGPEVIRRLEAIGLVAVVDGVAKARLALVEHHQQLIARHVLDQAEQHVAEAEHGADRQPLGVGQRRQREVRAEDVARPVDQDEAGAGRLGHGWLDRCGCANIGKRASGSQIADPKTDHHRQMSRRHAPDALPFEWSRPKKLSR